MYEKYFHLTENPFTIAPNPHYLYLSEQHREALAHLTYGLEEKNGSFILLTGEVGTGKTTLCRCLIEQVPKDVHLAMIFNPRLSEAELLETICREFGIAYEAGGTINALIDGLNTWLLQTHSKGWHAVIIVEEAQNLSINVLEQLRLLTNLETNEHKLIQIVLIGQPELLKKLEQPELRQLSQRIVARYHLKALNNKEVRAYIMHRLEVAQGNSSIFPSTVMLRIAQLSKGIPRLVNLLCDRALLGCYAHDKHEVSMKILEQAANEVFGKRRRLLFGANSGSLWASFSIATVLFCVAYWIVITAYSPLRVQSSNSLLNSHTVSENIPSTLSELPESRLPAETFESTKPKVLLPGTSTLQDDAPMSWEHLARGDFRESEAYTALLKSWQINNMAESGGRAPCELAREHQLDCWHRHGNFIDIRRINRPVLLKLVSDRGRPFYAALLSVLNSNEWKVGVGQKTLSIQRTRIENFWTGEYTVLWRRPDNFIRTVRPGDESLAVTWLNNQLALVEGRKVLDSRPIVYDISLMAKVRQLQRRCGLQVDGLIGKETIIMLNTINTKTPVLTNNRRGNCPRKFHV